jgi:hypothetical protein
MTGTRPGEARSGAGAPDDPEELREQIEQTRAELGDTVEALAAKADVKARAKGKVTEVAGRARQTATERTHAVQRTAAELKGKLGEKAAGAPVPAQVRDKRAPLAALAAGLVLIGLLIRRRRRR